MALAVLSACSDESAPPSSGAGTSGGGQGGGGGSGGGGDACAAPEPAAPSADWCARIAPGPAGERALPVDLSAAHAGIRFFSHLDVPRRADDALVLALGAKNAFDEPDLSPYAAELPGEVCALTASPSKVLPPAAVESLGEVAVVRPGTGAIALPQGTRAVLVDLRGLPDLPALREALEAAVAQALASPVPRPERRVRRHKGMKDEVFSSQSFYSHSVTALPQPDVPASGAADLPLGVLTEAELAPEAAELAGALRLANRAFVFGESVRAEVAEARWSGVDPTGLAYRVFDLEDAAGRWPDEIPADRRTTSPECAASELARLSAPPPIARPAPTRPPLAEVGGFGDVRPQGDTLGEARAALVAAHGALRLFFPYFATVGDAIDPRLLETLDDLGDDPDRMTFRNALRRLGEAISDGHNFVIDYANASIGAFPVYVEHIGGEPVVRRSLVASVAPGDTIVAIDGVPAKDWYATELARTSAATDGYRFALAMREYLYLTKPTTFTLRDPDGAVKSVEVEPQPFETIAALGYTPSLRKSGSLADLGSPDLHYLNMAGEVTNSTGALKSALSAASGAKGLVVDMRGYPGFNVYEAAMRLVGKTFYSPQYRIPVLSGPDERSVDEQILELLPLGNPSFSGPIALLVGHQAVSAAETFATTLVDAGRVQVFGRRSAGTNGDATGLMLPGGFGFMFTGMETRHADGGLFHGVGIAPQEETLLSAAAFRDGLDPELAEAAAWLQSL